MEYWQNRLECKNVKRYRLYNVAKNEDIAPRKIGNIRKNDQK